jgi:DNA polymerase III psi subunit
MTPEIPSRDATLEDVLVSVLKADITSRLRDDVTWALRSVARLLGCAPSEIPADARLLAMRLEKVSPQSAGISAGRLANIKSLLRQGLNLHGPELLSGRIATPMSEQWRTLYKQLPSRAHQVRLSKVLRWLSVRKIEPHAVQAQHLERFGHELRHNALMTKSDDAWRDTGWAWNSARKALEGWPAVEIMIPKRQQTYTRPWSEFPVSLVVDVNAYLDHLSGKDPLAPRGFTAVKPSTRATREWQLRALASGMIRRGIAAQSLRSLADLVHQPNLTEGLRYFLDRRNNQGSTSIAQLAGAMKAIAKHWVKVSPEHLAAIGAFVTNVTPRGAHGMTQKNRNRLRVFDDPENVTAILNLPQRLMQVAGCGRYSPRRSAVLVLDPEDFIVGSRHTR